MRSGACTVQQTLTAEAASVLKHSLSLARRRGHAQVTPLHVAATLLSSRTSLLRRACLKSQPHHHQTSHPLQCRALELCFNVALHRLPTTPSPLLHGQPSLSNALIAALKRAQAHQRRGCIEQQQQQPLLTIKVELEQLVISILDDPSVSRVMREAGFSSTAVKNNLEDFSASSVFQCYSTSGGVFSSPCSPSPTDATQREIINPTTFWQNHLLACTSERNPILLSPQKKVLPINHLTDSASSVKEDIKLVFEVLLSKKRKNTVIVGDCTSITEGLVGELIGRLERGEVPVELKQTQFIKFQFAPVSLRFMKRDDVDMNMSELKRKMDSLGDSGGAIIYTGDLKWTVEDQFVNGEVSGYSPVDHLVSEIGKLLSDYTNRSAKVWLMATSTYQTYMRCHLRQPPLENQWALQAVSVPSGGLGLSLHASSFHDSRIAISGNTFQQLEAKPLISTSKEEQDKFTCCPECTSNYEKEAQVVKSGQQRHLPPWLQKQGINSNQTEELVELRKKWHRFCQSLHQQGRHNQSHFVPTMCNNQSPVGKSSYSYVSSYPYWTSQNFIFPDSNPVSFMDSSFKVNQSSNGVPKFRRQQSCTIEFNFGTGAQKHLTGEPSLDPLRSSEGKEVKITLALGNSLFSDSGKLDKRKDGLHKLLQENVPWQSESIPFILEALGESESSKKPTWILIEGNDTVGKRRLALSIAESFCGSADFLLCMNMRKQENADTTCCEMLAQALRRQEKLVVLVEEVECADTQFLKFLADGLETGYFGSKRAGDAGQAQTIIILTKGGSLGHEDGKMDRPSLIQITLKVQNTQKASLEMPNMDHKRKKAEWINNTSGKTKVPRIDGKEDESYSLSTQKGTKKKEFSKQSSFNKLDLNIKANEDDDQSEEDKPGEFSPMSSDLTRETTSDPLTPRGFLELIKNRFVFDRNKADDQDKEMAEVLLSKFKTCLEEVFGGEKVVGFSMEERVLEELIEGSGSFVSSLFEKWLKDVFQTSLQTVNIGGGNGNGTGNGIEVRLCFGGRKYKVLEEDGFMGTCLPRKIQVSFMD